MMLLGRLSSIEVLRGPRPTRARPRERRIALGSAGSRAYSCPPRLACPRTAGGAPVHAHPHHADHVQGTVGVWVAASIEAMSDHLAAGGLQADTAQRGWRRKPRFSISRDCPRPRSTTS